MKATTNLVRSITFLLVIGLFFSCSDGEDGAIGPAGQDGINGQDGAEGVDGTDGQDGQDGADGAPGTANVIYSDWISADFLSGTESSSGLTSFGFGDDFDREVDVVLVYGFVDFILGTVYELPYFNVDDAEFYSVTIGSGVGFLSLRVTAQSTDGADKDFEFFDSFRYVIIPGGVSVSSSAGSLELDAKSAEDYKNMSYQEIIEVFNIPE